MWTCTCFDRSHSQSLAFHLLCDINTELLHLHCMNWMLDMTIVCVLCFLVAAVVCQQGVWRADRHWATVSQSLVHSPSLPQLWPLLCWFTRHDKGEGTVSFCLFACSIFMFCAAAFINKKCWFFSLYFCALPGVLWYLAGVDGRAGTLLWPCHSWWQGTFFYFI